MRRSHIAVGDVVRLSSRGSLRRRRGLVVVLEQGREVDAGPTTEVLARPRSAFAARLAGRGGR